MLRFKKTQMLRFKKTQMLHMRIASMQRSTPLKQACVVVVIVDLHLAFLVELQQPVAVLVIEFACQYSSDLAALTVSLVADSSDFVASTEYTYN
jgi:hypothetical protein